MFTFDLKRIEPQVQHMGMAWYQEDQYTQRQFLQELIKSLVGKTEITVTSEFVVKRSRSLELVTDYRKISEVEAKKITIEFKTPTWRD